MEIPKKANFFVIEGIAGSGKSTFLNKLKEEYPEDKLYLFTEEMLLFNWALVLVKQPIGRYHLDYFHKVLDFAEEILQDKKNVLVLERFHISLLIFGKIPSSAFQKRYDSLLERLKNLNAHVLIPTIKRNEICKKSSHSERKDAIWKTYLEFKRKNRKASNIQDLYEAEQNAVLKIVKNQKLKFTVY